MNKLVDQKILKGELDKIYNRICCIKAELEQCSVVEGCFSSKYIGPGSQALFFNGTNFYFSDLSVSYPVVNTYADLPLASSVSPPNNIYVVTTSTGTWPFNRKERGLWYSDGITWIRLGDVTPIFVDDVFQLRDNVDPNKTLQFSLDLLSTGALKYLNNGTGTLAEISDIPTDYISTNQSTLFVLDGNSSLFQLTANNSLSLDTNYTTHTHSEYINTSNSSLFQSTGNYLTTQSGQAFSALGGSSTFDTLYFKNANGASFSNDNGSIVVSYTVPLDYVYSSQSSLFRHTSADSQLQFTSQMSNYQLTSDNSLSLDTNYTTHTHSQYLNTNQSSLFELSSHTTVFLTTAMVSDAGSRFVNTSAGLNLTNISATFNSNSISLSVANPVTTNGLISAINLSAGTTSNNLSVVTFNNGNGITFGLDGSTITATVRTDYQSSNANYLTSQSNQAFSANNGSSTFQTLSFQDSNGISFSNNAGAVRLLHELQFTSNTSLITSNAVNTNQSSLFVLTANSSLLQHTSATSAITANALNTSASRVINLIAATNNTGGGTASLSSNISFSNANGFSFYTSVGNAIVGSYTVPVQTVQTQNLVSINGSTGNISFQNGNNVTFGGNAGTITASASFSQSVQTQNLVSILGSTGDISFQNANGITFGVNASTITASHNGLTTARASNDAVGLNTAQSNVTWTVNSSGISLDGRGYAGTGTSATNASITLDSNGLAISVDKITTDLYVPHANKLSLAAAFGQGTLAVHVLSFPNLTMDRVVMPIHNTNQSNSSGSHTLSFWVGIYSRNNSTLSLYASASESYTAIHSGTAGSYSWYSGVRNISLGLSTSLSEGNYWFGIVSRTTSGGANGSYSNLVLSQQNTSFLGIFGQSPNTTIQNYPGNGVYSATTSAMPSSIGFSQLQGSAVNAFRPPVVLFLNSTI